ncbi:MAG: STY4526/YPO1902 family pathogenicity island replication protein [Gammaproteobacteria bacterium]|nr:STY4526/YPO1902 family pathogenicity island replication protein [Gammaproteobacteria bacterium]
MDKAGDFVVALVIYAMRCIEDGEMDALARMGFGPSEVAALASLTFGDLKRIERLRSHHLDIKIDREAFNGAISRIRADGLSTESEHALIRADAPFDMMRRLFGTTQRTYTKLRQVFGVSSVGRPREPTDAQAADLWQLLEQRLRASPSHTLAPADYLAISAQTGIALRTVWRESKRVTRENV